MIKTKMHHISITSKNLKKDIEFYKNIFGFFEYNKYETEDLKIYQLKKDFILEIFWVKDFKEMPEYKKDIFSDISVIGINHFAFSVIDLEKFKSFLLKKEVKIFKDITYGKTLKYLFVKDFSGNLIEVVENEK